MVFDEPRIGFLIWTELIMSVQNIRTLVLRMSRKRRWWHWSSEAEVSTWKFRIHHRPGQSLLFWRLQTSPSATHCRSCRPVCMDLFLVYGTVFMGFFHQDLTVSYLNHSEGNSREFQALQLMVFPVLKGEPGPCTVQGRWTYCLQLIHNTIY